jgi:hypothetical protein
MGCKFVVSSQYLPRALCGSRDFILCFLLHKTKVVHCSMLTLPHIVLFENPENLRSSCVVKRTILKYLMLQ